LWTFECKIRLTRRDGGVGNVIGRCCGTCDEADNMGEIAEPAVTSNFEEIGSLPWIGNEDALQEVARMRCDILGEGEMRRYNVLVQEVDIVAFRVRWIVVER
jgi:hypothetical protein